MRARLHDIVDTLTSASVFVSLATYYLSVNKTWLVKHERSVASGVSIASYLIYAFTLVCNVVNMLLNPTPWQSIAEYVMAAFHVCFVVTVGLAWWVPGERKKGVWRLLRESLRTERQHLGALAAIFTRGTGNAKLIDLLVKVALVDGKLEAKERLFLQTFANAWGLPMDWTKVSTEPVTAAVRVAEVRKDVADYLAGSPPPEQALQLVDVMHKLVAADGQVSQREEMLVTELAGLLERYAGKSDHPTYEVHLVPQTAEQTTTLTAAFPHFERRDVPSGTILVAGTYFSVPYADIVRRELEAHRVYVAVERKLPSGGSSVAPEAHRQTHPSERPA